MAEKIISIEDLAHKINKGFDTMASKEDVQALDKKVQALDKEATEGFERVENLLLAKQEQRLNDLETRMKKLEDALAV